MFDMDIANLDATETLLSLADMHQLRTHADLQILRLAQHYADLFPDPATIPGHVTLPGGERGLVYGGPGCPAVAEFAAAEFGAMIGRSAGSAANLIGQALALRHRLPHLWAQVEAMNAEPWKACTVATACVTLSAEAAAIVDRRVAPIINTVTPRQLDNIVKAAKHQADPEAARAEAEEKAKERGVWAGQADEHGTTSLYIRAATGAVLRFKATLRQIADALADLGDTAALPQRLARAVDIISDPALTHELLTIAHHLTHTPTDTPPTKAPTESTAARSTPTTPTPTGSAPTPALPAPTGADPLAPAPTTPACPGSRPTAATPSAPAPATPTPTPAGSTLATSAPTSPAPPAPAAATPASAAPGAARADTPSARHGVDPSDTADSAELTDPAMDEALQQEVRRKLAAIRHTAYSTGLGATGRRPAPTTLYIHITDHTLLTGDGVARVERFGPALATRLEELLGHRQIVVKPVIDLAKNLNVNAYEIPRELRERLKLIHPVEQFPYGPAETTDSTDLDHIKPYDFTDTGPPGQTSITNLAPLRRYSHRVKTHGQWTVERLDDGSLAWTTRHGFKFRVTPNGTHVNDPRDQGSF